MNDGKLKAQIARALATYEGFDAAHLDHEFVVGEWYDTAAALVPFVRAREQAAARTALDGLIAHADDLATRAGTDDARGIWQTVAGFAEGRRDTHYPEESP